MDALNRRWYEDFFRGVALDFWRLAATPEQTRLEADFLEKTLGVKPGARVLDVPCGLGRHSLELSARGARMTGVDLSEEAIDAARRAGKERRLEIDWRRADMRDLPGRAEFDAAFCFGNSFGYIDPERSREFLRAVAAALKPGARFALDTGLAAESILPHLRQREWFEVGGILFLEENRYHVDEGCVETVYTFVRDGTTERRTGLQWVFTVRELRAFFDEAGFAVKETFQSLQREPFALGARYLIVVAEKR